MRKNNETTALYFSTALRCSSNLLCKSLNWPLIFLYIYFARLESYFEQFWSLAIFYRHFFQSSPRT